ncbi:MULTISPECIES: RCC1 domain-containing protein [unclassified Microbacterium]|uniref:RCC1 domain-containing protein n=1 Tax=unclassified Microbacterium TaxID=2609290 RepID=UPI002041DCFE|nr:RCC1 domain-containing protein [Microbacterium sp. USTB-Y]
MSTSAIPARRDRERRRTPRRLRLLWLLVPAVAVLVAAGFLVAPRFFYAAPSPYQSSVAAGGSFTCAITAEQEVKCWGANDSGQLGDGTFTDSPAPVAAIGASRAVALSAGSGSHVCALLEDGSMMCWGANDDGQLGDGTTTSSPTPRTVKGLPSPVTAIAVGRQHTCALASGQVYCWGYNASAELGIGGTDPTPVPTRVSGLGTAVAVSAGTSLTCALTDRGRARCWGDSGDGQAGAPRGVQEGPQPIAPAERFGQIAAGDTNSCAVATNGRVWCWGANDGGQLGVGDTRRRSGPVAVRGIEDAVSVSSGYRRSCAVSSAGAVRCWGGETDGAPFPSSTAPTAVAGLTSGYGSVSVGGMHTCAIARDRSRVECWGANSAGQLGTGTAEDSGTPVRVVGF